MFKRFLHFPHSGRYGKRTVALLLITALGMDPSWGMLQDKPLMPPFRPAVFERQAIPAAPAWMMEALDAIGWKDRRMAKVDAFDRSVPVAMMPGVLADEFNQLLALWDSLKDRPEFPARKPEISQRIETILRDLVPEAEMPFFNEFLYEIVGVVVNQDVDAGRYTSQQFLKNVHKVLGGTLDLLAWRFARAHTQVYWKDEWTDDVQKLEKAHKILHRKYFDFANAMIYGFHQGWTHPGEMTPLTAAVTVAEQSVRRAHGTYNLRAFWRSEVLAMVSLRGPAPGLHPMEVNAVARDAAHAGSRASAPVAISETIDGLLNVLERPRFNRRQTIRAAKMLYEHQDDLTPADVVRMTGAIRRNKLKDADVQGWLSLAFQRRWDGLTEEQRIAIDEHLKAARGRRILSSSMAAAMLRPVFSSMTEKESRSALPRSIARLWRQRLPALRARKPEWVRLAVRQLQDKLQRIFIPEDQVAEVLKISMTQLSSFFYDVKLSPVVLSIAPRYITEELTEAVTCTLREKPTAPVALEDVAESMDKVPDSILGSYMRSQREGPTVYLARRFRIFRNYNLKNSRNLPLPFVPQRLWKYLSEKGIPGPGQFTDTPTDRERNIIRQLLRGLAVESGGKPVDRLTEQDYHNGRVPVRNERISLSPFFEEMAKLNTTGLTTCAFILQRYGFTSPYHGKVGDIKTIKDFQKALSAGVIKKVQWKRMSLELKKAIVLELSRQIGKPLLWLTAPDYSTPLESLVDKNGKKLTLRGLFYELLKEQKRSKVDRPTPFYILDNALHLADIPMTVIHAAQTLNTKAELNHALTQGWIQKIPWRHLQDGILQELVIELALVPRVNKPIKQLTSMDYQNVKLPSLSVGSDEGTLRGLYFRYYEDAKRPRQLETADYIVEKLWPNGEPKWITVDELAAEAHVDTQSLRDKIHRGLLKTFVPAGLEHLQPPRIERVEADRVVRLARLLRSDQGLAAQGIVQMKQRGGQTIVTAWDVSLLVRLAALTQDSAVRENLFAQVLWVAGGSAARSLDRSIQQHFTALMDHLDPSTSLRHDVETLWPFVELFPPGFGNVQGHEPLLDSIRREMAKDFASLLRREYPHDPGTITPVKTKRLAQMNRFLKKVIDRDRSVVPKGFLTGVTPPGTFVPGALVAAPHSKELGIGLITAIHGNGSPGSLSGNGREATILFSNGTNHQFKVPSGLVDISAGGALALVIPAADLGQAYRLLNKLSGKGKSESGNLTWICMLVLVLLPSAAFLLISLYPKILAGVILAEATTVVGLILYRWMRTIHVHRRLLMEAV